MTTAARQGPVRLSYEDGQILVTTEDQDRFFISARKAVEACRDTVREEGQLAHFRTTLLAPIIEWCGQRQDRVHACYLAPAGPSRIIPLYIVPSAGPYDPVLDEEAIDLAAALDEAGWPVAPTQLPSGPRDDIGALFDVNSSLRVYGA